MAVALPASTKDNDEGKDSKDGKVDKDGESGTATSLETNTLDEKSGIDIRKSTGKDTLTSSTAQTSTTNDYTTNPTTSKKRPRSEMSGNDTSTDDKDNYAASVATATGPAIEPLLSASLYRMLDGIPKKELKLIVSEAKACEEALEKELEELKQALAQELKSEETSIDQGLKNDEAQIEKETPSAAATLLPAVAMMLETEVTPPDQHWTLSALLGRLRHDLTTPLPPNSVLPALREKAGLQHLTQPKKKKINIGVAAPGSGDATTAASAAVEAATSAGQATGTGSDPTTPNLFNDSQFQRLIQIQNHPDYKVEHPTTDKLLALWRKISTHKSSLVFRRPVNPKDAPGYSDRIDFPMDLSLIRKLIVSRTIRTYHDLAQRIHLIGHNCVKYNGRESDYALVTREFESYASEYIINAVYNHNSVAPPAIKAFNIGRPSKTARQTPTFGGDEGKSSRSNTPTASSNITGNPTASASMAGTSSSRHEKPSEAAPGSVVQSILEGQSSTKTETSIENKVPTAGEANSFSQNKANADRKVNAAAATMDTEAGADSSKTNP